MYHILLKEFDGNQAVNQEYLEFGEHDGEKQPESIPCSITLRHKETDTGLELTICAKARQDLKRPISLAVEFIENDWQRTEYVFLPGAVYNGNRQESIPLPYPPYHVQKDGERWMQVITDIPHLSCEAGTDSQIQLLSGDMSTPAAGYFRQETLEGVLIVAEHMTAGRYTGFTVQENGSQAVFRVSCPGVREEKTYYFGELPDNRGFYPVCDMPSDDAGILLNAGAEIGMTIKYIPVPAENLFEYFKAFNRLRETIEIGEDFCGIPFSAAYEAIKKKYVKMNFTAEGYYRVGTENTAPPSFWQAGWVGGGMNTYPFLVETDELARQQAKASLKFITTNLQTENGWYIPMYAEGKTYGDDFKEEDSPVLLVRKDADLLYFLLKQAVYLKAHDKLPEGFEESIMRQADAFVRFCRRNGQLGQFIDIKKETLVQGETASAAISAAALALAYEYFGRPEYLDTAKQLGEFYLNKYLRKGLLNGGPGEICQAPDSESAFGFLESCVTLYETTREEVWKKAAEEAFEFAITWVVSYDFHFPPNSAADRIHAHTRGTVFANAQNKHSAPGICTLSGNSMLKLYRFTGNKMYLEWMRRISHALSQFVSMPDRQIDTLAGVPLPAGYMNERVQMSDWEGKHTVGEFLYGSNWPEVSMLLTYLEIPGIYIDLDEDLIVCNDHIKAERMEKGNSRMCLKLSNDTAYDAFVTILLDYSRDAWPMGHLYFEKMKKVFVPSKGTAIYTV